MTGKINEQQSVDLLKRLIYRLKQKEELEKSNVKAAPPKQDENVKPVKFKSGKSLPSISEQEPSDLKNKAKQMFDDLDDSDGEEASKDNFNANELLNFQDYQNRRKEQQMQKSGNINIKDVLSQNKKAASKYD